MTSLEKLTALLEASRKAALTLDTHASMQRFFDELKNEFFPEPKESECLEDGHPSTEKNSTQKNT